MPKPPMVLPPILVVDDANKLIDTMRSAAKAEEIDLKEARAALDAAYKPVIKILEKYTIPDEQIQSVIDFSIQLLVMNRTMKPKHIARKTVEHFKLKLIQP